MGPRLQPVAIEQRLAGIGRSDHHVHTRHDGFWSNGWFDWKAELLAHVGTKRLAPRRIPPKSLDRLDRAHGADRLELRTRLPTSAENADAMGIRACHIFACNAAGGTGSHLPQ